MAEKEYLFVFDGGHGDNTPGKRSPDGKIREHVINDKIADKLQVKAKDYVGVITKRADDTTGKEDIPLGTRTDRANKWQADAYISIHQNAAGSGWNSASGVETYAYKTMPTGSTKLAKLVQTELVNELGLKDRGVKFADFHVLRETHMDAILVECGFMTDKEDAAAMLTDEFQDKAATAIMNGIAKMYGLKKKKTTPINKPIEQPKQEQKPVIVAPKKDKDAVHRIIIDGKQVGAYSSDKTIGDIIADHLRNDPIKIEIEKVK